MQIYSSQFSRIILEQDNSLLVVSWLQDSHRLNVEQVKSEISKILDYIDRHFIENIIIDSSHYYFSDNSEIQTWINYKFMPAIMNKRVRKYGIVMESMANRYERSSTDGDDELQVEYFMNIHDAHKWITT